LRTLPQKRKERAYGAARPIAIRSYRLYFRYPSALLARSHDTELASDEAARELAALMLNEQIAYSWVEVWDRTRLVCTVRRDENASDVPGTSPN
jgi:hypothetical protein